MTPSNKDNRMFLFFALLLLCIWDKVRRVRADRIPLIIFQLHQIDVKLYHFQRNQSGESTSHPQASGHEDTY